MVLLVGGDAIWEPGLVGPRAQAPICTRLPDMVIPLFSRFGILPTEGAVDGWPDVVILQMSYKGVP